MLSACKASAAPDEIQGQCVEIQSPSLTSDKQVLILLTHDHANSILPMSGTPHAYGAAMSYCYRIMYKLKKRYRLHGTYICSKTVVYIQNAIDIAKLTFITPT